MHDEKQSNLYKYEVLWKHQLISICMCFGAHCICFTFTTSSKWLDGKFWIVNLPAKNRFARDVSELNLQSFSSMKEPW